MTCRALSLKQPWAALLASGAKTIEVRRWNTAYRGPLLLHAARVPDPRESGWAHIGPELAELARLARGVIGVGQLVEVKHYADRAAFAADCALHLNDPDWFEPDGLFGLCFADLRRVPFREAPGYVRIFQLEEAVEGVGCDGRPPLEHRKAADPPLAPGSPTRLSRLISSLGGPRADRGS